MVAAAAIITGILSALVKIALPKLLEKIPQSKDVRSILTELEYIDAIIRQHCRNGQDNDVLDQWIENLRALAYDIEDCTDGYMSQVSLIDTESGFLHRAIHTVRKSVKMYVPGAGGFARKFGKLNKETAKMYKRLQDFPHAPTTAAGGAPSTSTPAKISIKDAEDKLLRLLDFPSDEKNLKVITIVGFCAQVTNFLAKQFYDSTEDGGQFSLRAWFSAAGKRAFQVHAEILGALGPSTPDNLPLAERLRSCLQNTRYLIVIDKVETQELHDIISFFPWADGVGGRIIATTTTRPMDTLCHCVSSLPVDNTAQFLKIEELTEDGIKDQCDQLIDSAQVLSTNYETLPSHVLKDHKSDLTGYVLSVLFLYFGMFPCDYPVSRGLLIKRWLTEGLISKDKTATAAFKTLIDSNIIQPIEISKDGKVKRCHPHVMMLDHISRKHEFDKFITLCCREEPKISNFNNFRRLSLHRNANKRKWKKVMRDLPHLRTMALFSAAEEGAASLGSESNLATFAKYKVIRVLDLKEYADLKSEHVQNICHLLLLKYLSLGKTIDTVPKEIAKLKQLETLEMRRTEIVVLPVEVIELPSLTHLLGKFQLLQDDRIKSNELKDFLIHDSKLERLSGFVTQDGDGFGQLMHHMVSLRKVKVWCNSTADTTSLGHLEEGIKKFIGEGTTKAQDDRRMSIELQERSAECSVLLMDSLQAQGRLTSLKLRGKLTQFPKFSKLNIEELCLSHTNISWGNIVESLNELDALRNLKLVEEDLGDITMEPNQLKGLTRICLVGVRSLHDIDISQGALIYLESLHILCKHIDDQLYPGIDIARHKKLEEVALHHGVDQGIKDTWQNYAARHPNRPKVLFIESGPDPPTELQRFASTSGATIQEVSTNIATASTVPEAIRATTFTVPEATIGGATTSIIPAGPTADGATASSVLKATPNEATDSNVPEAIPNRATPSNILKSTQATGSTLPEAIPNGTTTSIILKATPHEAADSVVPEATPNGATTSIVLKVTPHKAADSTVPEAVPNGAITSIVLKATPNRAANSTVPEAIPNGATTSTVLKATPHETADSTIPEAIPNGATTCTLKGTSNGVVDSTVPEAIPNGATTSTVPKATPNEAADSTILEATSNGAITFTVSAISNGATTSTLPEAASNGATTSTIPEATSNGTTTSTVPEATSNGATTSTVPEATSNGATTSTVPEAISNEAMDFTITKAITNGATAFDVSDSSSNEDTACTVQLNYAGSKK